jgi:hypothetical protein
MLTSEESLEIRVMYIGLMGTLVILYGLYAVRFFEISKDPRIAQTIDTINLYLKNAIIVLLLWYFNPIRKPVRFTEFHKVRKRNLSSTANRQSLATIYLHLFDPIKCTKSVLMYCNTG